MAILVVCSKCKSRFQVSDKFAGQKGPCPKCKHEITIPDKSEEVKIHAPETFGPKGAGGRPVLKPIFREETKWNPLAAGIVGGILAIAFIVALAVGMVSHVKDPPKRDGTVVERVDGVPVYVSLALGSLLVGGTLSYAGYTFLRDADTEPFRGQELWMRVGICAFCYALLWGGVWLVKLGLGLDLNDMGTMSRIVWIVIFLAGMLAAGGGIGHLALEIEYGTGLLHFGLFLVVSVLLRLTMGLQAV